MALNLSLREYPGQYPEFGEDTMTLAVDLASYERFHLPPGMGYLEAWTAYTRPYYSKWTVGMFGSSFVDAGPTTYCAVYRLDDLDRPTLRLVGRVTIDDHPGLVEYVRKTFEAADGAAVEPRL